MGLGIAKTPRVDQEIAKISLGFAVAYGRGSHLGIEIEILLERDAGCHVLCALNIRPEILFKLIDAGLKGLLKRLVDTDLRTHEVHEPAQLRPHLLTLSLQEIMHQHPRLGI